MTRLRNHLQDARREHRAARYPGDLAEQLLPAERYAFGRFQRWASWAVGVAAMAAAVTLAFRIGGVNQGTSHPSGPIATTTLPKQTTSQATPRPVMLVSLPDRFQVSVPAAPLLPTTVPVNVSLSSLQEDLGKIGPYSDRLLQQFQRSGFGSSPTPSPEATPTTRQAV